MMRLSRTALPLLGVLLVAMTSISCDNPTLCHLAHLAIPPDDLLDPVYVIRLSELDPGREHRFSFIPKYCESYEIGFKSFAGPIPPGFRPPSRVVATFSDGERVIATVDAAKPSRIQFGAPGNAITKFGYGTIGLPASGTPINVRLEFPEGLDGSADPAMEFYVSVSGSP